MNIFLNLKYRWWDFIWKLPFNHDDEEWRVKSEDADKWCLSISAFFSPYWGLYFLFLTSYVMFLRATWSKTVASNYLLCPTPFWWRSHQMEIRTMGVNHQENASASNMIEAVLRRLFMKITWCQYPTLMTSSSNTCFESAKLRMKSFVLLLRLIHFLEQKNLIAVAERQLAWM